MTAFAILNVNGAYPSVEMEGLQLLIGRYAIYKKKYLCRVMEVNRNLTCKIEIVDT